MDTQGSTKTNNEQISELGERIAAPCALQGIC